VPQKRRNPLSGCVGYAEQILQLGSTERCGGNGPDMANMEILPPPLIATQTIAMCMQLASELTRRRLTKRMPSVLKATEAVVLTVLTVLASPSVVRTSNGDRSDRGDLGALRNSQTR